MLKDFYGAGELTVIGFFFSFCVFRFATLRNFTKHRKGFSSPLGSLNPFTSVSTVAWNHNLDVSCETNFSSSLYPHLISDLKFLTATLFFVLMRHKKSRQKIPFVLVRCPNISLLMTF